MGLRRRAATMLVSIRTRLAVFFFLITLLAIAVVYVGVAPSLQSKLDQQALKNLALTAKDELSRGLLSQIANAPNGAKATASTTAKLLSLRSHTGADAVTVVQFTTSSNGSLIPTFKFAYPNLPADTAAVETYSEAALLGAEKAAALAKQRALQAQRSHSKHGKAAAKPTPAAAPQAVTQSVSSNLGVVAVPFIDHGQQYVFVFSANTSDVHGDVVLIRQRILTAAAIALAVVLLLGVLVARALTVRVLRLERAAQRVAKGDFTAQFEVDSHDELGQLAAALAHMQSQLQELEHARRRFIAVASHELRTRRPGASSSDRYASRSRGSASSQQVCSTSRGSKRARSISSPHRPTSACSRGLSPPSSSPHWRCTTPSSSWNSRRSRCEPPATPTASRSC